ncbi:MAG: hypothetical protein NC405_05225 [Odoribacter sp.]|nr:hypothetical protein [Odoribacter sp.]
MKKLVMLLAVASLLASCDNKAKEEQEAAQRQALQEASRQELATAVSDRDQLLSLVNDISSGMDQIKRLENILTVSDGIDGESASQRAQIEADIAAIQATLQQRREQLADLETRLQKSKLNTDKLQATIQTLRSQIDSQAAEIETLRANLAEAHTQITTLNTAVDSLNTTVNTVTDERNIAQQEATDVANELNTCFYVAASKGELKAHKILETPFLRKSKLLKGDFDQNFFVTADKRTLTSIALHSTKAKVLTNQPADSYRIVDENGQKVLRILDPTAFWSLSNYLVIQID